MKLGTFFLNRVLEVAGGCPGTYFEWILGAIGEPFWSNSEQLSNKTLHSKEHPRETHGK